MAHRTNSTFPKLKRWMLSQAHNSDLWASYRPQSPHLFYLLAGVGILLIILGGVIDWPLIGRIFFMVVGVLLIGPLAASSYFAHFSHNRRGAVRQQVLDAVLWRGDESVLDVGCGSGMLLNGAAQRVPRGNATGIDIWAANSGGGNLDLLHKHARVEGVTERIVFKEMDARQMSFADASFDVVLSSWAVHHIVRGRDEFEQLAAEMIRVLKPGGTMVVLDITHMIDALALRMERAGLDVRFEDAPLGQKVVIGRKS